ncbi:hypothetical protein ACQCN2_10505 [Brevibacillus ginsengisoli]|uniref:hypothetical protein n=1 Tax=Brevibacillus ginsengisoli TaxID=363854 RepID=UPI003CF68778
MGKLLWTKSSKWKDKRLLLLVTLIGICFFAGGIVVASEGTLPQVVKEQPNQPLSDLQWAMSKGLVSANSSGNQSMTQAEFLKMLLAVYKPAQQGVIVPHGAENHWAAPIYATAQNEALFDCSCQIKPDEKITFLDASKFIFRAINKKAGKELVKLEDVQSWVKHNGDITTPVTYTEVSSFLHKMDGMVEANLLEKGGKKDDPKNDGQVRK